jgi:hypothetical protein
MKNKMLLPLLAILIAVSAAFVTKADETVVSRWGNHISMGCITGTLLQETNCGTAVTNKGRCIVEFDDESTADAFDVSGCVDSPLYKQN